VRRIAAAGKRQAAAAGPARHKEQLIQAAARIPASPSPSPPPPPLSISRATACHHRPLQTPRIRCAVPRHAPHTKKTPSPPAVPKHGRFIERSRLLDQGTVELQACLGRGSTRSSARVLGGGLPRQQVGRSGSLSGSCLGGRDRCSLPSSKQAANKRSRQQEANKQSKRHRQAGNKHFRWAGSIVSFHFDLTVLQTFNGVPGQPAVGASHGMG